MSDYELGGVSDYEPDYEEKSGAYSDYEDVNEGNKTLSKRSARVWEFSIAIITDLFLEVLTHLSFSSSLAVSHESSPRGREGEDCTTC